MSEILDRPLGRDQWEVLEILGYVCFLQGRSGEARVIFEGMLALDENCAPALKHLAALALERGEGEEALRRLEAYAARAGRDEPPWRLMRAQALRLAGRNEEAARAMGDYLALASPAGAGASREAAAA